MSRFTVNLEMPDGELVSWSGEADDSGHAADLAREDLDPADVSVVIDVFEEED